VARAAPGDGLLKTWLLRALQLAVTVAVTWLILERLGPGLDELAGVDPALWVPDPVLLVAASLLLLVAYFVSAALWGLIVRELGGPRLPLSEAIPIFMIANLGRYVPGKIWQIAGLAALARGKGVAPATAAASAVLGQGIALVAASAVGLGALLAGPESYRRWGLLGAAAVLATIALLSVPGVFRRLAHAWFRLARTDAPSDLGMRHGLRWLVLYAGNWVLYALSFWVLSRSLGLDGALLPVASAFAAAYVLGYVMVFAPAGLGPREGFLIVFLTPHVGAAPAGVLAIVSRLWTTGVELVPAGIFWLRWLGGSSRADAPGREGP
jgi:glycosyltransferase 2 family protein